jgi:hypothetical protein
MVIFPPHVQDDEGQGQQHRARSARIPSVELQKCHGPKVESPCTHAWTKGHIRTNVNQRITLPGSTSPHSRKADACDR